MSTLFTISQSWFNRPALYEQLAFSSPDDSVLLIQDGVLALQSSIALASFVAKCEANNVSVLALKDDCDLRGINSQYKDIALVDYAGFVDLVARHTRQVAW